MRTTLPIALVFLGACKHNAPIEVDAGEPAPTVSESTEPTTMTPAFRADMRDLIKQGRDWMAVGKKLKRSDPSCFVGLSERIKAVQALISRIDAQMQANPSGLAVTAEISEGLRRAVLCVNSAAGDQAQCDATPFDEAEKALAAQP